LLWKTTWKFLKKKIIKVKGSGTCPLSQPLGKLRQEDHKFEAWLVNLVRLYLKIKRAQW
jgi:hypothetical protein